VALVFLHDGDGDVPSVIRHRNSNQDPLPLQTMYRLRLVDVADGVACEMVAEFDVDAGAFFS
jgi:hypothetical protein